MSSPPTSDPLSNEDLFLRFAGDPATWALTAVRLAMAARMLHEGQVQAAKAQFGDKYEEMKGQAILWTEPVNIDMVLPEWFVRVNQNLTVELLQAFAMENLLKAILVMKLNASSLPHVEATKREGWRLLVGGHNLPKIAEAAGLTLAPEDIKTLTILARAAKWAGRYQTPMTSVEFDDDAHVKFDVADALFTQLAKNL